MMKTISLHDKIRFFNLISDLQNRIWTLERRIYYDEDRMELNKYHNRLMRISDHYNNINRLCNEYNRFIHLTEQNKFDNLLSFMKCMKRLGIEPEFDVNLNEEFDFEIMWTIINDDDKVVLSEEEFLNIFITVDNIIDNIIEISEKEHNRFSNDLKNMMVI